jgi:DNA-binding transcriptional LysR family regulator
MDTPKLNRINLTLLRAFDAVARNLSFSGAAAGLGRSQATISVQVRELERQLDVRLLDRSTRRVSLTEAGEALASGLKEAFEIIAASLVAAREFTYARRGRVVVACVPSLSGVRLPAIIAAYRKRDAAIPIDVEELTYVEMVDAIQHGSVDFGIGPCADPPPANIIFNAAVDDILCILLPANYGGGDRSSAPLSMLSSLPLIFLSRSAPLNKSLKEVAQAQGIKLTAQTKVRHVHTAIGMVRAGVGAAIVPRLALPDEIDCDLLALPIDDTPLIRKVGVLTLRGRRLQPSASELVRYVRSSLARTPVAGFPPQAPKAKISETAHRASKAAELDSRNL